MSEYEIKMGDEETVATKADVVRLHRKVDVKTEELQRHIQSNIRDFGRLERALVEVTKDISALAKATEMNSAAVVENSKAVMKVRLFQVKANLIFGFLGVVGTGVFAWILKLIFNTLSKIP